MCSFNTIIGMIVLHQMLTCTLDLAGLFHNYCNLASIILLKTIFVKIMNMQE